MIIGCFALDPYCDCDNESHELGEFPAQFTGETRGECMKAARRAGWAFTRDKQARCRKCRGRVASRQRMYDAAQDRYIRTNEVSE